jgi:phosphoesterase RecJ-like protein
VDIASPSLFTDDSAALAARTDLCIDHHVSNEFYAARTLLDASAAACGEIILALAHALNVRLDMDIAELLFISITTDTGCFRYANTTSATLRAAAEVLEYGFDAYSFIYSFFELKTRSRFALERSIMENAEFFFDGRVAFSCLSFKVIDDAGATDDDLDNISGLLRTIEGVQAGLLFRQKADQQWKLSMRSVPGINASIVCSVFGGGGHPGAAGATLTGNYEEVKQRVLQVLSDEMRGAVV